MLVANYNEMKAFLPAIEMKAAPSIFSDALDIAQQDLVAEIIGTDLETQLETRSSADAAMLKLCQRVISISAFLSSIPELDLVLTDAGFGVVSNQDLAPASKDRVQALTASLQRRLDESKDRLVTFLMKTDTYSGWRGTEEFARLSDGLILTFADFRDVAVYSPVTAELYPKTWSEFLRLNAALNVALMSDVAAYISKEYASELLEKIRDNETLLPVEVKVLHLVKIAVAAIALGDRETGLSQAIKAMTVMQDNLSAFPTFAASSAAADMTNEHSDTPIFSMF